MRQASDVRANMTANLLNAVVEIPVDKRLGGGVISVQCHYALDIIEQGSAGYFDFTVACMRAANFDHKWKVGSDEHVGVLCVVALRDEGELFGPPLLIHDPAQLSVPEHNLHFSQQEDAVSYMTGRAIDRMMESMLLTEGMHACLKA